MVPNVTCRAAVPAGTYHGNKMDMWTEMRPRSPDECRDRRRIWGVQKMVIHNKKMVIYNRICPGSLILAKFIQDSRGKSKNRRFSVTGPLLIVLKSC